MGNWRSSLICLRSYRINSRLLHSRSLVALSVGYETWSPIGWTFVIGRSKYRLGLPQSQWMMDFRSWWEFLPFFTGHWQSPCTALTAGRCLPFGLCKETVEESRYTRWHTVSPQGGAWHAESDILREKLGDTRSIEMKPGDTLRPIVAGSSITVTSHEGHDVFSYRPGEGTPFMLSDTYAPPALTPIFDLQRIENDLLGILFLIHQHQNDLFFGYQSSQN